MARNSEFYKGRRRKRNYALIPFIIVLGLVAFTVVLFYGMQKYAVISKDGVSVELPILSTQKTTVDAEGNVVKVYDTVDAPLVFDSPDYSDVTASAGKYVTPVRAIFVPNENLTQTKLDEYAGRLNLGNALILEMKPRSGALAWNSNAEVAYSYGLSMQTELTNAMPDMIAQLKEKKVYLIAQISCCIDDLFATRSTTVSLRNEIGANLTNDKGNWLDPYNVNVRNYTVELAEELFDMGFDEVLLADVAHPTLVEKQVITYTRDMSTKGWSVPAVCGFAMNVTEQLRNRKGILSVKLDSKRALVGDDEETGQNGILFMKIFDRVYLETDKYAYPYNVADIEDNITIGSASERLVPIVENYLPDNSSWVLVDVAQEDDEKD